MGAARATGGNGTTIASDFSGEHSSGAGVPIPAIVVTTREAEKDGEHNERGRARGRVVDAEVGFIHRGRRGSGSMYF
jgi:hypothetical protein